MGAKAVKTDGHSSIEHSALTQWWALRLLWHLDWNFGLWNRKGTASGLVLGARLEYQTQQRWNWSLTSVLGQWDWTLYWRMGVHRDIRHNKDRMDQQRRRSVSIVRGVKPGTSLLHAVRETHRNLERRTERADPSLGTKNTIDPYSHFKPVYCPIFTLYILYGPRGKPSTILLHTDCDKSIQTPAALCATYALHNRQTFANPKVWSMVYGNMGEAYHFRIKWTE